MELKEGVLIALAGGVGVAAKAVFDFLRGAHRTSADVIQGELAKVLEANRELREELSREVSELQVKVENLEAEMEELRRENEELRGENAKLMLDMARTAKCPCQDEDLADLLRGGLHAMMELTLQRRKTNGGQQPQTDGDVRT